MVENTLAVRPCAGNPIDEARAVRAVRTILAWRYALRGNAEALNTLQQLSAGQVGQ